MDLLLLQGHGFSFGLYLHVRVPPGACDVTRGATNTIMREGKDGCRSGWRRRKGCHGSFVRRGWEIQGGVLLVFSLHRHTRRRCFVSVRGKKRRRFGDGERAGAGEGVEGIERR